MFIMEVLLRIRFLLKKSPYKNYDSTRQKIFNILKKHNLTVSQDNHVNFYKFIEESYNIMYYQKYIVLCCGLYDEDESLTILNKIIDRYYKGIHMYSFKKLFKIDSEWYDFFKENTDIDGNTKPGEERMGVDKDYVDDIIIIKKKIYGSSLMNAIKVYSNIVIKKNSCDLDYVRYESEMIDNDFVMINGNSEIIDNDSE